MPSQASNQPIDQTSTQPIQVYDQASNHASSPNQKTLLSQTVVEVLPQIVRTTAPLQLAPHLSMYAVYEPGKTLLIDAASAEIYESLVHSKHAVDLVVEAAGNPWSQVTVFITHYHPDHVGLISYCKEKGARVVVPALPEHVAPDRPARDAALHLGLDPEFEEIHQVFSRFWFPSPADVLTSEVEELAPDEVFEVGGYSLRPIPLYGHHNVQTGLYDKSSKIIFAADALISRFRPIVPTLMVDQHHLRAFFDTLELIDVLDCDFVLSGHGPVMTRDLALLDDRRVTVMPYDKVATALVEKTEIPARALLAPEVPDTSIDPAALETHHELSGAQVQDLAAHPVFASVTIREAVLDSIGHYQKYARRLEAFFANQPRGEYLSVADTVFAVHNTSAEQLFSNLMSTKWMLFAKYFSVLEFLHEQDVLERAWRGSTVVYRKS